MGTNYIYINNIPNDGTVFQTQVLDWLKVYDDNGINFKLFQLIKLGNLKEVKIILKNVKNVSFFIGSTIILPSRGILVYINALLIFLKLFINT